MPSETAMGGDQELDPYLSSSASPLLHSCGTGVQNGTQNGSYLPEGYRSDVPQHINRSPSHYFEHQLRRRRSPEYCDSNGRNLSSGVVDPREGRRLQQGVPEGNRSGLCVDEGFGGMMGLDTAIHNDLSEIFQGSFSYPYQSSASSNGLLGPRASINHGSILGSPLSKNGAPDPEIAMRVPSPCIPPIGVNRRMTTNGSSTFSNASIDMDRNDQMISAFSALNLQQGTYAPHSSFISGQADPHSYVDLDRNNFGRSPILRNFSQLPESNAYTRVHMDGAPFMFNQTGNGGCTSPDTSWQQPHALEFLKKMKEADSMRKMKIIQQLYGHEVATNYMLDSAYSSFPIGDQIWPGDCGMMGCSPNMRKSSSFSNHITTLLEEVRTNKTRSYELSEISGHVVSFSMDQHGSRFIQQKLETATTAEKDMVFTEILPHAITLMTDVFGNYVVQKFFEHGSSAQIKKLATELNGRVLQLSLQMYGCRVIQKAIEVVDLEQQKLMVAELEHSVMRCVRDQNGNHVIQKCIECVPQDVIHFIISTFYGHVLMLSTHAYGCRVIQRVLEHCDNPETQEIMMKEILENVILLSQDQYGNYVVQHVLVHGKPLEKSEIIGKLAGQIVNMSRQKYASNVVEKCLTFGSQAERQKLIDEMLGPTEENKGLQEMMKDQFGNYVVQKVLETCNDNQREMIMTRVKIHLTALKKYTYGKHIVARVEKLVVTGESLAIQSGASLSIA